MGWGHRRNHPCQVSSQLVQQFRLPRGLKFTISHRLGEWLLQQCYALTCYTVMLLMLGTIVFSFCLDSIFRWNFAVQEHLFCVKCCVICVFCLLVVPVRLSVPVQVIDWKVPKWPIMTCVDGDVKPYSLIHCSSRLHCCGSACTSAVVLSLSQSLSAVGRLRLTDSAIRYDSRRREEFRREQQLLQQQKMQQQQKPISRRKSMARRRTRRKSEFIFEGEGEGGGMWAADT